MGRIKQEPTVDGMEWIRVEWRMEQKFGGGV